MRNETDNSPLAIRIGVEAFVGIISALSVAPAISIVDQAIVSNASGRESLVPCIMKSVKSLVSQPMQFVKQPSFLLILGVYSCTYTAANTITAVCERRGNPSVGPKFVGSSLTNVACSVMKDKSFARLFGTGPPRTMPVPSFALFAVRDSMTIFASFTMPEVVERHFGCCANTAQLITPCAMQFVSTPLHLLGLDLYNRQERGISATNRMGFIAREYLLTAFARCTRILPAFGIGGVVNREGRIAALSALSKYYR
jgi:hypothetical protein